MSDAAHRRYLRRLASRYPKGVRRRLGRSRIQRPLANAPLPNKLYTRLRYGTSTSLSTAASSIDSFIMSANGLYDPEDPIGGHQPRGFDQLMTMYDHYTVVASKINVTFRTSGDSGTASLPITAWIILSDDNTSFASSSDIYESSKLRYSVMAHPEGNRGVVQLSKKFNAKQFFTKSKVLDDDNLRGDANNNPGEGAFFHIGMDSFTQLTTATVDCLIVVDYVAVLSEPKQPTSS